VSHAIPDIKLRLCPRGHEGKTTDFLQTLKAYNTPLARISTAQCFSALLPRKFKSAESFFVDRLFEGDFLKRMGAIRVAELIGRRLEWGPCG
jgi:hypothetical protein